MALLGTMPDPIRVELLAFKRWTDARASLAGKLLLRELLADLQLPFTLDDIRLQDKERPFISETFDFNISHSGALVAVALALGNRIGIDIEKHRPVDPGLFRKYFSENEWAQVDPGDPLPAFFRLWAIKEAAIKCDGRGVEVLGKTEVLDDQRVRCDGQLMHYRLLETDPGYAGALCSLQSIPEIIVITAEPFAG